MEAVAYDSKHGKMDFGLTYKSIYPGFESLPARTLNDTMTKKWSFVNTNISAWLNEDL